MKLKKQKKLLAESIKNIPSPEEFTITDNYSCFNSDWVWKCKRDDFTYLFRKTELYKEDKIDYEVIASVAKTGSSEYLASVRMTFRNGEAWSMKEMLQELETVLLDKEAKIEDKMARIENRAVESWQERDIEEIDR